jgi:hypothetical protein
LLAVLSVVTQCIHGTKSDEQVELNMETFSINSTESRAQAESDAGLKVADAVWVGTALLQKKHENAVFSTEDIVSSVQEHRLTKGTFKSVWQHVNQHCVSNRPPQPNRICMLTATGKGYRRLFRPGDKVNEERKGAPTHPEWDVLPKQYQYLRNWYEEWAQLSAGETRDPLLELVGTWKDEPADDYVAHLRENWSDAR